MTFSALTAFLVVAGIVAGGVMYVLMLVVCDDADRQKQQREMREYRRELKRKGLS